MINNTTGTDDIKFNYAAILLEDGSELLITDAMLEQSLNDPQMIELSKFIPSRFEEAVTIH